MAVLGPTATQPHSQLSICSCHSLHAPLDSTAATIPPVTVVTAPVFFVINAKESFALQSDGLAHTDTRSCSHASAGVIGTAAGSEQTRLF